MESDVDFGSLITKTWQTVSGKQYLLTLGALAVIAPFAGVVGAYLIIDPLLNTSFDKLVDKQLRQTPGVEPSQLQAVSEMVRLLFVGAGCSILVVGLIFWVNSRISEGGLIASVRQIANGQITALAPGWLAGIGKVTQMVMIGLVLVAPVYVLMVATFAVNSLLLAQISPQTVGLTGEPDPAASALGLGLSCLTVMVSVPLYLFRTLADRACVLENRLVGASLQRSVEVFRAQTGPVLLVFLIEFGLRLVTGLVLGGLLGGAYVVGTIMAAPAQQSTQSVSILLCLSVCCLTPLVLLVGGISQSYSSGLWTLAWLEWTGERTPLPEPAAPAPAPSV